MKLVTIVSLNTTTSSAYVMNGYAKLLCSDIKNR